MLPPLAAAAGRAVTSPSATAPAAAPPTVRRRPRRLSVPSDSAASWIPRAAESIDRLALSASALWSADRSMRSSERRSSATSARRRSRSPASLAEAWSVADSRGGARGHGGSSLVGIVRRTSISGVVLWARCWGGSAFAAGQSRWPPGSAPEAGRTAPLAAVAKHLPLLRWRPRCPGSAPHADRTAVPALG